MLCRGQVILATALYSAQWFFSATFDGRPSLLIQVGNDEVLFDDAVRLNKVAKKASVDSSLEVWNGQVHVWPLMSKLIPEARQALQGIGTFIKTHT